MKVAVFDFKNGKVSHTLVKLEMSSWSRYSSEMWIRGLFCGSVVLAMLVSWEPKLVTIPSSSSKKEAKKSRSSSH